MNFIPYPILCKPVLVPKIWGGDRLWKYFEKGEATTTQIGESWEISTVAGSVSTISNGAYQGKNLQELLDMYPEALLGERLYKRFGTQFPLLIKYIDAKDDLSVQVHPNDELAKERHQSFGKTEMWHIVDAQPGANIIAGMQAGVDEAAFKQAVAEKRVMDTLCLHTAEVGQTYFLETGTVHAIGAGVLLAEIQQTSDITYRIYDFDRVDDQGKPRELHLEQAWDAIDYARKVAPFKREAELNQTANLVNCPYFITDSLVLKGEVTRSLNGEFQIVMCLSGYAELSSPGGNQALVAGTTVLLPAQLASYTLKGEAKLLLIRVE